VEREREKLAALVSRAELFLRRTLVAGREAAALQGGKLHALSPLATLARGYAVVTTVPGGGVVRDGTILQRGDRLDIRFSRGHAVALVETAGHGGSS
jgi:exodeoxyribonuclease VII large subunit